MKACSFGEDGIGAGSTVGRWRLGEPIGAGGMGVVFEAEQTGAEFVAVKVLRRRWLADGTALRRFRDEGVAGRLVRHRNVAAIIECGETADGVPFLMMERVLGEPLGLLVGRDGPLSPRRAAAIGVQILAGLDAMHRLDIVHGDVKSDNILVGTGDDGIDVAKLIDFGLAHVQSQPAAPVDAEYVAGTPDYMAPEVISGRGVFPASDLYGVGVILYEVLTGTTPFGGGTAAEILERHLEEEVVPPSLRAPGSAIPRALERTVMRALEKDRRDRFSSALAFAGELARAMPSLDTDRPHDRVFDGLRSCEAPTIRWTRDQERGAHERRRFAIGTPGLDAPAKKSAR